MSTRVNGILCYWLNGKPSDQISIFDRALAFGDGLFETILVCDGKPLLLDYHLERLGEGIKTLKLPIDISQLQKELILFCSQPKIQKKPQVILKLLLTRGIGGRGYSVLGLNNPQRILMASAVSSWQSLGWSEGKSIRAELGDFKLSSQSSLAGVKHLNRLEQVLARMELDQRVNVGELILLDNKNNLIEATSSNLFLVKGKKIITPDLSLVGVNGCVRRLLLDKLQEELGIEVKVTPLKVSELKTADELFITNAVMGVQRISQVGLWQFSEKEMTSKIGAWVDEQRLSGVKAKGL